MFVVLLNRLPSTGISARKGTFVGRPGFGGIQNAAEDHGLAVVDQNLGDDFPGIDGRDAASRGARHLLTDESSETSRSRITGCPA